MKLGEEAAAGLAIELRDSAPEGLARLTAGMIVLTVSVSRQEAVRVFTSSGSAKKANAAFFALVGQGLTAVQRMLEETANSIVTFRREQSVSV